MLSRFTKKKVDREWLNTNFPCMMACPAHTNAGRYVSLIAEGRFEEAYRFARDPNPMASICGRVCAHPCETACRRGEIDRPISIRALEALSHRAPRSGVAPSSCSYDQARRESSPTKWLWSAADRSDCQPRTILR